MEHGTQASLLQAHATEQQRILRSTRSDINAVLAAVQGIKYPFHYGFSGNAEYSQSKIDADHLSASEQSGLYAGDDGFQVAVSRHTELNGGLIVSSQSAEQNGRNRFQTGSLGQSDLANHSRYSGKSFGFGMSGGINGKGKQEIGESGNVRWAAQGQSDANGIAQGRGGRFSQGFGFGKDQDSQSSTTRSGIGTRNIQITDAAEQQRRSAQSVQQAAAGIYTDRRTETADATAGYLKNGFDRERVEKELALQQSVMQQFDQQTRPGIRQAIINRATDKYIRAMEIRAQNNGVETAESRALEAEAAKLEQTASYLDTALGILWAGKPDVAAAQVTAQHAQYAKNAATHITAGQIYRVECTGPNLQYFCRDIYNTLEAAAKHDGSLITKEANEKVPFDGVATQIFDPRSIMTGGTIVRKNPGIYNNKEQAFRNAVLHNPRAAQNGTLYVVVNNPSAGVVPGLSEVVFYAGYDKINEMTGAHLPLTNAQKTNVQLNLLASQTNTKIRGSDHSRGTLTESVSLQYTNNILGVRNIPLESVKFHGPAANGVRFLRQLRENGYKDSNGVATTLFLASNNTDFVGSGVGANPTTAGTCVGLPFGKCYNHSSYNGWETIERNLKDANGQDILDARTGKAIVNPEFRKVDDTVETLNTLDGSGRYINPTLPKIFTQGADGNLYTIDRFGNVSAYDPRTLDKIEGVKLPQATKIRINGTDYFEFQGRRYHAKPFN